MAPKAKIPPAMTSAVKFPKLQTTRIALTTPKPAMAVKRETNRRQALGDEPTGVSGRGGMTGRSIRGELEGSSPGAIEGGSSVQRGSRASSMTALYAAMPRRATSKNRVPGQPTNSGSTKLGMTPASKPRRRINCTACRPRGPKSKVQSLTYMPTN